MLEQQRRSYARFTQLLTNLHNEPIVTEGVIVHHYPPAVAYEFANASAYDSHGEEPGLVSPTLVHVDDHGSAEEGDKQGIRWKRRFVTQDTPDDTACFESASGGCPEGHLRAWRESFIVVNVVHDGKEKS